VAGSRVAEVSLQILEYLSSMGFSGFQSLGSTSVPRIDVRVLARYV
jgi:hypothetical protein